MQLRTTCEQVMGSSTLLHNRLLWMPRPLRELCSISPQCLEKIEIHCFDRKKEESEWRKKALRE